MVVWKFPGTWEGLKAPVHEDKLEICVAYATGQGNPGSFEMNGKINSLNYMKCDVLFGPGFMMFNCYLIFLLVE